MHRVERIESNVRGKIKLGIELKEKVDTVISYVINNVTSTLQSNVTSKELLPHIPNSSGFIFIFFIVGEDSFLSFRLINQDSILVSIYQSPVGAFHFSFDLNFVASILPQEDVLYYQDQVMTSQTDYH